MSLRHLYRIDGWLMLVVGFAFWGYDKSLAPWFGIDVPAGFVPGTAGFNLWKAISFGGALGGSMMAFGFASLAIARSSDAHLHLSARGYFVAAHAAFTFVVFAKHSAFWGAPGGVFLVNVAALPGVAFFYFLIAPGARSARSTGAFTERERRLREVAGQEERTRLAQDLHDSVKQQIYSVQANLAAVQARWGEQDTPGAADALKHARASAQDAMTEMTALLDRLRQDPVESVGLVEALRRQCEALQFQTGAIVSTTFSDMPAPAQFAPGVATTIFRIAQEALANVARHARAEHVTVDARTDSATGEFVLIIGDDGQGFDEAAVSAGAGLSNMRARAEEAQASVTIDSRAGEGCAVRLGVPLRDPRSERVQHHQRGVLAGALLMVLFGWTLLAVPESRAYLWPVIAIAAALAAGHGLALLRLRWL